MRKNKRTMRLLSVVLTLAMVFSLYLPVGVYADATEGTDQIKEQVNLDYMRNYANELLDEDKFQVDNQEIGVSVDKRSQKVIVNGDKTTLLGSTFTLAKDFNFDSNAVSRFSFDGLAKKGTKVKLGFYLDGATEPFATQTLHKQKKKNDWTYSKEDTFDVSALKLTGKHNLTFKVLEASEDVVEFAVNYVEFVESSIPIVYLDIDESDGDTIAAMNGDELHETECYGTMNVQVPDGYTSVDTGKALKGGSYKMEYIRGRGNSTWGNDKNPYKIKLDKKANVLGMGKNKHWVLLANYYDNSLVRNRITYWLGHQLGMDYTPDLEPVDVVMNGEYLGSYFLAEQVRIGENRIEIDDLEDLPDVATEPEITGGYLLSLFPYGDEDDKKAFNTNRGVEFLLESPAFDGMLLDEEDYNKAQYEYIKDYVQDVENALFGKDFENKNGVSYRDLMDIESAAMYYWIQEFSLNGDAYYSTSSYLYKPRNGKLYWGPLWDFDYVAWGSMEYEDPVTEGFQMNEEGCAFDWNYRLFEDRQFQEIILDKWENALKPALKELIEEGGQLDKYMQDLEVSARYNFEKYNPTGFEDDGDEGAMAPLTYKQEIERLREWITARLAWVDENVSQLAPQETTITFYDDEGNILEDLTKISYVGKPVGILPKGPEKEGYVFAGWEREYSFESLEAMLLEEWDMTLEEYIEELREYMDEEEVQEILGSMAQNLSGKISVSKDDTVIANMALKPVYIPIEEYVPASEIYFEQGKYYAQYYEDSFEEIEIEYQITPFDATFSDLTWESSDESIAKVSEYGTVEILAPGDVIITATAENGVSKSVDLHVYTEEELEELDYPIMGPKTIGETIYVNEGEYAKVDYYCMPDEGINYGESTDLCAIDDDVVEVGSAGVIYGAKAGETYLICTCEGTTTFCKVVVTDGKVHRGDKFTRNGIKYQVTGTGKYRTVKAIGLTSKKKKAKSLTIPATIKVNGQYYKVTSIATGAFKGMKNLKTAIIGKNVGIIGKSAFRNCKKLKTVKIYAPQAKIYSTTFKNIAKKAVYKVKKSALKYYKLVQKNKVVKASL